MTTGLKSVSRSGVIWYRAETMLWGASGVPWYHENTQVPQALELFLCTVHSGEIYHLQCLCSTVRRCIGTMQRGPGTRSPDLVPPSDRRPTRMSCSAMWQSLEPKILVRLRHSWNLALCKCSSDYHSAIINLLVLKYPLSSAPLHLTYPLCFCLGYRHITQSHIQGRCRVTLPLFSSSNLEVVS
jgi:hypothetical protein